MKVTIYSRKAIERRLLEGKLNNTAVISFCDPKEKDRRIFKVSEPVNYKGKCERVMQIALHDIDIEVLGNFGLSVESYFPNVDELAKFIYQAKNDGLDIICQCEYGQSRSAGCAAAILQHFSKNGIDVFADYRYYPNQLVYNKVFNALEKIKNAR